MKNRTDLFRILRYYSNKINSPSISFSSFSDYMQKYARHYLEEAPELVIWLDDTASVLQKELDLLTVDGRVIVSTDIKGNKQIFLPQFFIDKFTQRYKDIEEHIEIPYPLITDIHRNFPDSLIKKIHLSTNFTDHLENDERDKTKMYQLEFSGDLPSIVFPGSLSISRLLPLSLSKIRLFLRKDESRDYIQKRIMSAAPGKELTIKNYFTQFQTRSTDSLQAFKHSGEAFMFWSYLCSFIRQDFVKKAEKTPEDIALLQSVSIVEFLNNYYKTKVQQELQRETALKNLELSLQKAPYFFNMNDILRFTDSRGIPLLGQYKEEDLQDFIKNQSDDGNPHSLPSLLVFKSLHGERYFVLKEKIYSLIIRLCNDARNNIKEHIIKEWKIILSNFRQEEAMTNQVAFEKKIELLSKTISPILYSVLKASFIPLLAIEDTSSNKKDNSGYTIFYHGRLLPWSELLMLNKQELLTDARILLPFWYSIPIISAIISFFRRPREKKLTKQKTTKQVVNRQTDDKETSTKNTKESKKTELKNAASKLEKTLIPEGSTLQEELEVQLEKWNRNLDSTAKQNLTDDVNSLIRDYLRRIFRTLQGSTFSLARIENLSTALVDTPNLMKIKNRDALLVYTQLYILFLIKNMK